MSTVKQKPPPTTPIKSITIKKIKTPLIDIDVTIKVLTDRLNAQIKGGETSCKPINKASGNSFYFIPGYSWKPDGASKKITELSGPLEIKAIYEIQTSYGPKAKPTDTSAYGKGTTTEDENSGNTSLGFHESCHRNDYINYLKSNKLPVFGGKVGQTIQQYDQAKIVFEKAIKIYSDGLEKYSERLTDEVGYKKSTFDSKGPKP